MLCWLTLNLVVYVFFQLCSQPCNLFQHIIGNFLFASQILKSVMNFLYYFSVCVSYSIIFVTLEIVSDASVAYIPSRIAYEPIILLLNNYNVYYQVAEEQLPNTNIQYNNTLVAVVILRRKEDLELAVN